MDTPRSAAYAQSYAATLAKAADWPVPELIELMQSLLGCRPLTEEVLGVNRCIGRRSRQASRVGPGSRPAAESDQPVCGAMLTGTLPLPADGSTNAAQGWPGLFTRGDGHGTSR